MLSQLGETISGQGRHAEAETMLVESYRELAKHPTPPTWFVTITPERPNRFAIERRRARERVVALYEAWGKQDQAEQWRAQRVVANR